jgi:hypothetical protein
MNLSIALIGLSSGFALQIEDDFEDCGGIDLVHVDVV